MFFGQLRAVDDESDEEEGGAVIEPTGLSSDEDSDLFAGLLSDSSVEYRGIFCHYWYIWCLPMKQN